MELLSTQSTETWFNRMKEHFKLPSMLDADTTEEQEEFEGFSD